MNKIKILFYSGHGEEVGGDAQYLFDLINNLDSNKHEIELFTDKNYFFTERAKQWFKKEIKINYLDTRPVLFRKNIVQKIYAKISEAQVGKLKSLIQNFLDKEFLLGYSIYRWLNYIYYRILAIVTLAQFRHDLHNIFLFFRLLKKKKREIDIIHFNNGGYPAKRAVLIAIVVAYYAGIRNIVMTSHSVAQPKKWYKISDHIFDYFIPRFCKKIITPSENLRLELNKRRRFPLDKIKAIVLGLNDSVKLSSEEINKKKQGLSLALDQPVLMIVSALYGKAKGHYVLLNALTQVKKEFPEVQLLIVGDGKDRVNLENFCQKLELQNNVKFLGYRTDIEELYNIIDVSLTPSLEFEAIPYAIREALRAGKAVIATDAGGCVEAVINEVNGLVVRQNDSRELAKAILKLLKNKELTKKQGEAGRKIFEEKFLLATEIQKHEQVYLNILNKK